MNYKSKKYSKKNNKFRNELCANNMTFQDCELAILRHAVDETEKIKGEKITKNEQIKDIISIVEKFLRSKKLICYGGTAINEILPKEVQFYNRDIEIPDYDFYSPDAMNDAKELADIYYKKGYSEVEAKAGVHFGTYKVFVNFIPIADITQLHKNIFKTIHKESINVRGIRFAPPNFLRMNMYLELSRPQGDVSRWEKVLKRLNLLNMGFSFQSRSVSTILLSNFHIFK
jgi:ribosomal protein S18